MSHKLSSSTRFMDHNPNSFPLLNGALSCSLSILRQETFVLSECSGFGASGRAREGERARGEGRRTDGRTGGREGGGSGRSITPRKFR